MARLSLAARASVILLSLMACSPTGVAKVPAGLAELHQLMTPHEVRQYLGHSEAEYELVYIPAGTGNSSVHKRDTDSDHKLSFRAFGRSYSLKLERNRHLLTEASRIVRRFSLDSAKEHARGTGRCHFLHSGDDLTAAVSRCRPGELRGFVSDGRSLLDIAPLTPRLREMAHARRRRSPADGLPHIVRRTAVDDLESFLDGIDVSDDFVYPSFINPDAPDININLVNPEDTLQFKVPPFGGGFDFNRFKRRDKRTLELALYVDKPARETFLPFFDNDLDSFVDFLLGFINQIQALYYLPSLGVKVDITINYLEVMEVQQMRHFGGERGNLLTSFCKYNTIINSKAGENKWDMGLYLSGLNFFSEEAGGQKSQVTMGLAVIGGVCLDEYSCVIGELGVTNQQGKPYPSAGFTAAYIMAHEIGHNLGMSHDSQGNVCPKNGYIMSPSRGTKGETTWSSCSRQILENMPTNCLDDRPGKRPVRDHRIFRQLPGQVFDAHDQCQLFLRDKDAELFSPEDLPGVCTRVKCKSPHRIGYYFAGPALEGTYCGNKKWCISGACRAWSSPAPPVIEGGWGEWNVSQCSSGCTEKAQGVSISRRRCDSPKPLNTERRCDGPARHLEFCPDRTLCNYRVTSKEYASQRCREFSQLVDDINPAGIGTQVPYTDSKPWSACSIYCRLYSGTWYTPRQDLNDMGVDTYFPDGTWCHNDGFSDYYCQLHECQPKLPSGIINDEVEMTADPPQLLNVLQNALPGRAPLPPALTAMHQVDSQLHPVPVQKLPEFAPRDSQESFAEPDDVMTVEDIKKMMEENNML